VSRNERGDTQETDVSAAGAQAHTRSATLQPPLQFGTARAAAGDLQSRQLADGDRPEGGCAGGKVCGDSPLERGQHVAAAGHDIDVTSEWIREADFHVSAIATEVQGPGTALDLDRAADAGDPGAACGAAHHHVALAGIDLEFARAGGDGDVAPGGGERRRAIDRRGEDVARLVSEIDATAQRADVD
jgi:hypothetical protein